MTLGLAIEFDGTACVMSLNEDIESDIYYRHLKSIPEVEK